MFNRVVVMCRISARFRVSKLTQVFYYAVIFIFLGGVLPLTAGTQLKDKVDYGRNCTTTEQCFTPQSICLNGTCQCSPDYIHEFFQGYIHICKEETGQIEGIVIIEDHPWVIKNETCLQTESEDVASSCRDSPCYSGLLIDVLHQIDENVKILENCTLQLIQQERNDSAGSINRNQPGWTDEMLSTIKLNETDLVLALVNFTNPWSRSVVKLSTPLFVTLENYTYGLGYSNRLPHKTTFQFDLSLANEFIEDFGAPLFQKWFQNITSLWTVEKQLTPWTRSTLPKMEIAKIMESFSPVE
ncbi:uncharacterized protein LOC118438215 [Folsomia candida]|uniref:uncharacterized protein LOC118438215 n=1 Tax=Folsomia candida TaxID=158441 RepID=UPI00160544CB|nr:uncharacterized protein LOC118438215 [Folsomia candida]